MQGSNFNGSTPQSDLETALGAPFRRPILGVRCLVAPKASRVKRRAYDSVEDGAEAGGRARPQPGGLAQRCFRSFRQHRTTHTEEAYGPDSEWQTVASRSNRQPDGVGLTLPPSP